MLDIEELKPLIVERLKSLQPSKIILFGSYAYGAPTDDSDLDLCIIQRDQTSKSSAKKEIRNRLKGILIAKDILTPSLEEFEFYKNQHGSVFMDIDQKGRVLWQNS